jgi:predicted dehydrogenase
MAAPVRIAIFGNGFARTVILPCLRRVPGAQVVGLASPNLARAKETGAAFGIGLVASDHREILERTRPDLVFVTTPPHRHEEMSLDALRAGCHVVCEKPMALDAGQTARMLAAAGDCPGRLALIDHELRFLPARQALRLRIERGELGVIDRADYLLQSSSRRDPAAPWSWWSDAVQGGGALGAIASHAVDSLRVLLGEVTEARGILMTHVPERVDPSTGRPRPVTADDFASALLRFRRGTLATVTVSMVEPERVHRITLSGAGGAARLDEQGPLLFATGGLPGPHRPWMEKEVGDDLPPSGELGIPETDWARAFLRLARLVVAAVGEGRPAVPGAATFADGHRVQMVLDAIRASDRTGGWRRVEEDPARSLSDPAGRRDSPATGSPGDRAGA